MPKQKASDADQAHQLKWGCLILLVIIVVVFGATQFGGDNSTPAPSSSTSAASTQHADIAAAIQRVNTEARGYFEITSYDQSVVEVQLADDFPRSELYKTTHDLTMMYYSLWGSNCTVWVYRRGVKVAEGQTSWGEAKVTELGW